MPVPPPPPVIDARPFHKWAATPPMGWNSWDCWGTAVTEAQTKANADYMAAHLKSHGWQYVVVDIQWYEPASKGFDYRPGAEVATDGHGRLVPAATKFPSAANGAGFKPLADYVHGKGLKFGVHLMRGIPRQAADRKAPILGTDATAADVADRSSTCDWNTDMFGVDASKPAGRAYYDSVFELLASWGVDYVKVDDLSRPYHRAEIEAIRSAIDKCGRPIVLSLSPGPTPIADGVHVAEHGNLWRISGDFWDSWPALAAQFDRCEKWAPYAGPGHWPDADMLPVGRVRAADRGWTHFTPDEQVTMMTLWSLARSPLMVGGHLPDTDAFTLGLLTNDEVIAVDQHSAGGHAVRHDAASAVWAATDGHGGTVVGLFNLAGKPATVSVPLADVAALGPCGVRDLWHHTALPAVTDAVAATVPAHGAVLVHLTPGGK